jgi:hypothetical protein
MIGVGMGDDEEVDGLHTKIMQKVQHIAAVPVPCIDQDSKPRPPKQSGLRLTYVEIKYLHFL